MVARPTAAAVLSAAWEREQDAIVDRLIAGFERSVDRRNRLRADALAAAKSGEVDRARGFLTGIELVRLLAPTPGPADDLAAPLDAAVLALIEFTDGNFGAAEALLIDALVANGRLAVEYGLSARRGLQIHLGANIARVRSSRGEAAGAAALARAVLECEGSPAHWPFPDGPLDPWAGLPELLRDEYRAQLNREIHRAESGWPPLSVVTSTTVEISGR
jgi:hypothetical protein